MRHTWSLTLLLLLRYSLGESTLDLNAPQINDLKHNLRGQASFKQRALPQAAEILVNRTLAALAVNEVAILENISYVVATKGPIFGEGHAKTEAVKSPETVISGSFWQRSAVLWQQTLSNALQAGIKAASDKESNITNGSAKSSGNLPLSSVELPSGHLVPGVIAIVYEEFFSKASAVAVKVLQERFRTVSLKTASAVAHIPVLGDFLIRLEDVKLDGLDMDQTSTGISLGEDGSFVLAISGLAAIVEGHFSWRRTSFPFIKGACQARVTAQDGSIQLRVSVLKDSSGRPQIGDIQAPELTFSSIAIVTSEAKLAWLYNAVANLAQAQIQNAIIKEVSKQVKTTVPMQINELLQGVPTTVVVKGLQLNTSLVKDPELTPDRLVVWDWGQFKNPVDAKEACPFVRQLGYHEPPILPGGSPYMLIANIDESIANCLTWDLFRQGKLTKFLVGDEVPQKALFTDTWRFIVPEVYFRCPGCAMALHASVTSSPHTTMDPSRGVVTQGGLLLQIRQPLISIEMRKELKRAFDSTQDVKLDIISFADGSGTAELSFFMADDRNADVPWTPLLMDTGAGAKVQHVGEHLFTLSLSGELTVKDLRLEPDLPYRPEDWKLNLAMKVNESALFVDVLESDVGTINKAALHLGLTVAAFLVEDQVNHGILKNGFPLPDIPHIRVDRANVTVAQSALALGTDLSYIA